MDIARGHLAKLISMSLLIILATQVHCSAQKNEALFLPTSSITPQSPLDDYVHYFNQLEAFVPISLATPAGSSVNFDHATPRGSSVDLDQLSSNSTIDEDIERARNYPWVELLWMRTEEVAGKVNEIIPSASIVVKQDGLPAYFLQDKGPDLTAVLFSFYNDFVYAIVVLTNK